MKKCKLLILMLVGFGACASPQKRFEKAVVDNDLPGVESALAAGAKPTPYMIGGKSRTALEHAIHHKNREMVARLLNADAPVRNSVSDAMTAAIASGDLEIVKMLVATNKFPPQDDKGLSARLAINWQKRDILEYLISAGFPVNSPPDFDSPLDRAIDKNDTAAAILLLRAGANPSLKNKRGTTDFCSALAQNRAEIAQAMLESKPDVKTHCGNGSPLYWAEKHNNGVLVSKIKALGGKSEHTVPKTTGTAAVSASGSEETWRASACETILVGGYAKGGKCYDIRKIDGKAFAYDYACGSKTSTRDMDAKILAGCALGGKPEHFIKMGLRIPARNEYR